jgi:Rod binding domain-containing protein
VNIKATTPLPLHPAIELTKSKREAPTALHKAAEELETSFLHQLLESAKIGGKDAKNGYGSMAVDALAQGIQAGGGLGLARQIERALDRQHEVETARTTTEEQKR